MSTITPAPGHGGGHRALLLTLALLGLLVPARLNAAETATMLYTYDALGRLTTALNPVTGVCIAYSYDANGNRTAQTITISGAPITPVWGGGVYGCFSWTPR